jgi:type 1 glutamine amidotransferase
LTKNIARSIVLVLSLMALTAAAPGFERQERDLKNLKVLIYTRNGKGYVHASIPDAVAGLKKLAARHNFIAVATDDATVFTDDNLKQYSLLIFASTNNDVFDTDEQRLAFRRYIQAGGGLVGIHSVVGTERSWKWFKTLIGGTFVWHPRFQRYRLVVVDPDHPSVAGMPPVWEKEDECYFQKEMHPGIHTIMAHDLTSLDQQDKEKIATHAGPYSELYPAVWHHAFDGGYVWITALGHHQKDYEDATFMQHLLNGIRFIAGQAGKPDYARAYATNRDEPVRNNIK